MPICCQKEHRRNSRGLLCELECGLDHTMRVRATARPIIPAIHGVGHVLGLGEDKGFHVVIEEQPGYLIIVGTLCSFAYKGCQLLFQEVIARNVTITVTFVHRSGTVNTHNYIMTLYF